LPREEYPNIPVDGENYCRAAFSIAGVQAVSKFTNEGGCENDVYTCMTVLRFPSPIFTDILITVCAPQRIAQGSSEALAVQQLISPEVAAELLSRVVASLAIVDWGLFIRE
jgi:hypothetical protein